MTTKLGFDGLHLNNDIISRLLAPIDDKLPRTGLNSLRISSFIVSGLAEGLSKKVPLRGLKHLQLVLCDAVVGYIQILSQLEVDLVSYHADFGRTDTNIKEPNEEILRLMTSPKRLSMSLSHAARWSQTKILCDWPAVTARAASLQSFSIDDDDDFATDPVPPTFLPRDMSGFSKFCCAATNVQQLSISCPPIEKDRWDDVGGFDEFLVSRHVSSKNTRLKADKI